MATLDLEIRSRLVSYLSGETTLRAFRDWYVPNAWNVNTRRHGTVEDLVNEIDLRLAEFTSGHWSEDELKDVFYNLVSHYRGILVIAHNGDVAPEPPYSIVSITEAVGEPIPVDIPLVAAS